MKLYQMLKKEIDILNVWLHFVLWTEKKKNISSINVKNVVAKQRS